MSIKGFIVQFNGKFCNKFTAITRRGIYRCSYKTVFVNSNFCTTQKELSVCYNTMVQGWLKSVTAYLIKKVRFLLVARYFSVLALQVFWYNHSHQLINTQLFAHSSPLLSLLLSPLPSPIGIGMRIRKKIKPVSWAKNSWTVEKKKKSQ